LPPSATQTSTRFKDRDQGSGIRDQSVRSGDRIF
jgi:hypothetical protein